MSAPRRRRAMVLGYGLIGGAVARQLSASAVVDVRSPRTDPNLFARDRRAGLEFVGHLRRHGIEVVVNCAGRLAGSPTELDDANHRWPAWLSAVLSTTDVRLVHLGSASEYGDPGSAEPIPEIAPADPQGVYGETKWAGSRAVLDATGHGLRAVVARVFNLVAADIATTSPLDQMRRSVTALPPEGGDVALWWPDTIRDLIALDDAADAVAALALVADPPAIVNVCTGTGITFAEITRALGARHGVPVTIHSLDKPGIAAVVGDNRLLHDVTGLSPTMSADLAAAILLDTDGHPGQMAGTLGRMARGC
jgi:nucleoside-diphosphate-sugar epimerase